MSCLDRYIILGYGYILRACELPVNNLVSVTFWGHLPSHLRLPDCRVICESGVSGCMQLLHTFIFCTVVILTERAGRTQGLKRKENNQW